MKKDKDKSISIRVHGETHYKLFYIAEYEGRSGNGQLLYLLRKCIEEFEEKHGKIILPENLNDFRIRGKQ